MATCSNTAYTRWPTATSPGSRLTTLPTALTPGPSSSETTTIAVLLSREYRDLDLVFASNTGSPTDGQNVANRSLKPILKAAGLSRKFRWYDCRHSCATLLLAACENPKVVSERLGHATVTFTLDRYAHVLPGMQEAASERLEAILFQ